MRKVRYFFGLISLFPLLLQAEVQDQDFSELNFDELMQVEVTSVSKKSEKLSEAAAAVYVVTESDIRRSGATCIPEALRLVPGVDVAQIDPNKWAVSIRGFNGRFANKLLVLIDGRSVYTPTYSGVYWEYFDYLMADIKRIEVIRGPGATLWGANAVNGIINIITREAGDNPGGQLSLSAGNELQSIGLRQGGDISENSQLRTYVKGRRLDESENLDGAGQDNGGDYLQTGLRWDLQPSADQWLIFQGDLYRNDLRQQSQFPNFESPYGSQIVNGDIEAQGGNVGVRWGRLKGVDSELTAKFSYDFYKHDDLKYSEDRDTFDFELQHQFSPFLNHELVWGAGYRWSRDEVGSTVYLSTASATEYSDIWNFYVQDTLRFPEQDISLTVGSKLEGNSYSGAEVLPNIRVSWVPSDKFTLWGAASRALRTPSLIENEATINIAVYPTADATTAGLLQIVGQDSFESEQVDAYELGVRWMPIPEVAVDLATFYNQYKDLLSYSIGDMEVKEVNGKWFYVVPLNLDNNIEGYSRGLELLTTWEATSSVRFRFSYSLIDMELSDTQRNDYSASLISLMTDRSPTHQASVWSSFDLSKRVELDLRLYYTSERSWTWSTTGGEQKISDCIDSDLRLGWQAMPSLRLSLVGRNLLHSTKQEFITESWESDSLIERSFFINSIFTW